MILERYIGEIVDINPKFHEVEIKWCLTESCYKNNKGYYSPAIWFIYKNKMYFGLVNHDFGFWGGFDDIILSDDKSFNSFNAGELEWNTLMEYEIIFYELDYQKAIIEGGDLDEWCEYELDFIKVWLRDSKLNELGI